MTLELYRPLNLKQIGPRKRAQHDLFNVRAEPMPRVTTDVLQHNIGNMMKKTMCRVSLCKHALWQELRPTRCLERAESEKRVQGFT